MPNNPSRTALLGNYNTVWDTLFKLGTSSLGEM
jgi:hypothetical protein